MPRTSTHHQVKDMVKPLNLTHPAPSYTATNGFNIVQTIMKILKLPITRNRKPKSPANFHLLRYFSATSLLALMLTAGFLSWFYQRKFQADLSYIGETSNVELTKMLSRAMTEEIQSFIHNSQYYTNQALATASITQKFETQLQRHIKDLAITKVKLFDPNGRTIYSTDLTQIGGSKADYAGFQKAINQQVFSALENYNSLRQFWQLKPAPHTLLSSYIPIYNDQGTTVIGVMEMYRDVTPFSLAITLSQQRVLLSVLASFILLYLALFSIVNRAANILKRQQQELTNANTQLTQKTQEISQTLAKLKETQAQLIHQEKMSGLGRMVAGVAHELNNPTSFVKGNLDHTLNSVQDLLELLQLYQHHYPHPPTEIQEQQDTIDLDFIAEDLPRCLQSMKAGTSRIQDIVLALRIFSRLDEAKVKSVAIAENLASIWGLLNYRLMAHHIEVIEDYANLPPIECDAAELNQVFFQILSNAIDALAESDRPHKTITITGETIDHHYIRLTLKNNGNPIDSSIQGKIFDPFFTTKPIGQGTGMGLTICYQIIQKHQGTIEVHSTPQATAFVITLPIQWQNCPVPRPTVLSSTGSNSA